MQRLSIAVIGTGLIGGSILLRLRGKDYNVMGWDPDPATAALAVHSGLPFTTHLEEALRGRDVAFLAAPQSVLPDSLVEVAKHAGERCILTDVGGAKQSLSEHAARHGLGHRFVPGHPMAGTERSGLAAASASLLRGCAWVLCPGEPLDAFRLVATLLIDAFEARVVPMRPALHDVVVALSSHVPHVLAGALASTVARSRLRAAVLSLAAGSFHGTTRVAGTPTQVIVDMMSENRDALKGQLASVRDTLEELIAAIDDEERATQLLAEARQVRRDVEERSLVPRDMRFGPDEGAAEEEFLVGVGSRGGYLTRCETGVSGIAYTALHTPGG
ncbi:MAG TPA: prephenate dehydrogenase/arogenate dehydrogenase family protein [Candidatus Limnocylindrales bacterium]